MLAVVNTPGGPEPVAIREVAEPQLRSNEALLAVDAFSLNRGELRLFQVRPEGWRPGQDIAASCSRRGRRRRSAGTRVVALAANRWAERAVPSTARPRSPTMSFAAAAALPVARLTALRTLRHGAPRWASAC
jgi:NADPH:quinone reductase-like Zn-dependent oxidoreductase